MMTDDEILDKHDVSVRPRCRMELKIVNKIIADAKLCGFKLEVKEYKTEGIEDQYSKENDIKGMLFNLDDARLLFIKNGRLYSYIRLVFGNNGYDVVSDYGMKLEDFLRPTIELADRLENGRE